MAKKVSNTFLATVNLNKEKGGGWLAHIVVSDETGAPKHQELSAWKNASAAKKWVKEQVKVHTPRKSVSLVGSNPDEKEKPTRFVGELQYKVEA